MGLAKRGLGKGLGTLIPEAKSTEGTEEKQSVREVVKEVVKEVIKETDKIGINQIEPNTNQPRKVFNEDSLQELADSIKQHGLIEPLIVQEGSKGFYRIIAGERRWRAAKMAGLKEIPVIIKEYTNQQIMEIALIENIQREDLNPIEEAEAYQRLISEYHLKQDEVAERVSKSRVAVTNTLRLLKLDDRVRTMLIEDKIKSGHARALLALEDGDMQYETAVRIFDEKLSVRETEKLLKQMAASQQKKEEVKEKVVENDVQINILYQDLEEKLKTRMGTKVNINRKSEGKGKIEIEYYSGDELDRIINLLMES